MSGTAHRTHRAQRGILRPATQGGTVGHEKRRDHNHEGDKRNPERHHVEMRKGHVFRSRLNRQEEVAKRRERGRGEDKKDHDRAVHGHQLQVVLGGHHVSRRTGAGKQVEARDGEIAPAQVDTHEPGKEHPHHGGDQSQRVILLADDFVVQAEDMLPNEACWGSMLRCVG